MAESTEQPEQPEQTKSPFQEFLHNNRYIIISVVAMIGLVFQAYFMYLTTSKGRPRNLMILEKAPVRIVARWDSTQKEDNPEFAKLFIAERVEMYKLIEKIPYENFKFNENLYVRVNTLDMKTDNADIKLDERSSVNETENIQDYVDGTDEN